MQHIEEGRRIIDSMLVDLQDCCKVESPPRMEGKQMTALLAPKGAAPKGAAPAKPKPPSQPKPPGLTGPPKPDAPKAPPPAPQPPTA